MRSPKSYQRPVIQFVTERDCTGVFLEKRLGKSPVSIRWAISTGAKRILIVAPLSAIPDWMTELAADGQRATNCTHPGDLDSFIRLFPTIMRREFAITNAQALFSPSARNDSGKPSPKPIALLDWDAVIWDESTALRNPQAQTVKVAHACFGDVRYKAILSGEYAPEGPEDIFEPQCWCFGSFMGFRKFWPWRDHFFQQVGFGWHPKMGSMKKIKAAVMENCYILSRKDAGVGEKKTNEKRYCDLPQKFREIYDHCEKFYELPASAIPDGEVGPRVAAADPDNPLSDLGAGVVRFTKYAPVLHSWLAQLAGGYPKRFPDLCSNHKMALLEEIVAKELATEPLVVSFAFNAELFEAERMLSARGVSCVAVWGSMPGGKEARAAKVKSFQKGEVRVILKQAKIHFGMDLARADTMIRYSLPRPYLDISQDRDRIVNPARKEGIVLRYIDLVTRDSIDEDILEASSDKRLTARIFAENVAARFEIRREGKLGA
jgi:hypothetical protein